MDFGSNSVLERAVFGLKCVLHRVRVSQCRPSRVIQNPAEQPPPRAHFTKQPVAWGVFLSAWLYLCYDPWFTDVTSLITWLHWYWETDTSQSRDWCNTLTHGSLATLRDVLQKPDNYHSKCQGRLHSQWRHLLHHMILKSVSLLETRPNQLYPWLMKWCLLFATHEKSESVDLFCWVNLHITKWTDEAARQLEGRWHLLDGGGGGCNTLSMEFRSRSQNLLPCMKFFLGML